MKLSYAVALPDCQAKKMRCFRGDLDTICGQLRELGYDGVELFARRDYIDMASHWDAQIHPTWVSSPTRFI